MAPRAAATDRRLSAEATSGMSRLQNGGEQHEREDDDNGDEQRKLAVEDVREVDRGGNLAADVDDEAATVLSLGDQAVRAGY